MMNITIVGQGAIGLLWYHHLTKDSNNNISLACSSRLQLPRLETYFTDINNQTTSSRLILSNDEKLSNAELILICVKSYHLDSVLTSLAKKFNPSASIIFCHNGMVDVEKFKTLTQPCYALLTTHASKILQPFHAQHTGLGHNDLGLITGKACSIKQDKILQILTQALPTLTLSDNIKEKQWLKLAINCIINPITAIDNIDNGLILNDKYIALIDSLLAEITTIASYQGLSFTVNDLKNQVLSVAIKTTKNCSSMRSDIIQKRKTEIDYINGYIVDLAKDYEIPTPENEKIVQQINALEQHL